MNFPHLISKDYARCNGVGYEEDGEFTWREGCEDCARRIDVYPGETYRFNEAPKIITFECIYHIPVHRVGSK